MNSKLDLFFNNIYKNNEKPFLIKMYKNYNWNANSQNNLNSEFLKENQENISPN